MDEILITLSRDEALVLFEWLASRDDRPPLAGVDAATDFALLRLEGQLESNLVEVFAPDYNQLVAEAKRRLAPETDSE